MKDHDSKPVDKYCWIKADPTFGGLRQITNEPEARVNVGRLPPKVDEVQNNKTRYLAGASIRRTQGDDPDHVWFDIEVPLSVDMVAIIGNKGSGNSREGIHDTLHEMSKEKTLLLHEMFGASV